MVQALGFGAILANVRWLITGGIWIRVSGRKRAPQALSYLRLGPENAL